MSSVIFQPLLHDPLGWKQSKSTYADTYKWKHYRSPSKDKRISTYGQQYQKQLRKQHKLQQLNDSLPTATNEEETTEQVILMKKNEESRGVTPLSHRRTPTKTPTVVVSDQPPAFIVEYKQRSASTNREATCGSRTSQRSLTITTTAIEETSRSATSLDARRSPKDEKEKVNNDSNDENSRHWLTYPNPKTPQYLIDIKQRLGQLKVPSARLRPKSAVNTTVEQSESSVPQYEQQQQQQQQQATDQRHFLDFNLPQTPNELRAARHRLERHRYNSSLDDYPPRPQTCPVPRNENSKPITPPNVPESNDDQQLPPIQTTTSTKEDVWINEEETKPTENETSSIMVQMVDYDGLPNEYIEALEIASMAQEEFLKNLKNNNEKKSENFVYRLPSMSLDNQTDSFIAYRNQQQSANNNNNNNNNNSTRQNEFGSWVRNATDKERESAMKILNDVLNQPIIGYDIPKQRSLSKKSSSPSASRINSATRKLGRTRNPHKRIPCEICEKALIKHHVWNLNRSDTLTCPHQAQGIKPPIIQIRA